MATSHSLVTYDTSSFFKWSSSPDLQQGVLASVGFFVVFSVTSEGYESVSGSETSFTRMQWIHSLIPVNLIEEWVSSRT